MIYDYFRVTGVNDSVLDCAELFSVVLRTDNIHEFEIRWDDILLSVEYTEGVDELEDQCSGAFQYQSSHSSSYHVVSVLMDSTVTLSRRLVAPTGGLTGSPPRDAPVPMLTMGDGPTEDGHAMMECDTFHSFRNLSHAVRGCNETVNKCAKTSRLTCTCHKTPAEKWQVDCEAKLRAPWEVADSEADKRYSVMDLRQDSHGLCLQIY